VLLALVGSNLEPGVLQAIAGAGTGFAGLVAVLLPDPASDQPR
jgi:hypothetical protein